MPGKDKQNTKALVQLGMLAIARQSAKGPTLCIKNERQFEDMLMDSMCDYWHAMADDPRNRNAKGELCFINAERNWLSSMTQDQRKELLSFFETCKQNLNAQINAISRATGKA